MEGKREMGSLFLLSGSELGLCLALPSWVVCDEWLWESE